MTPRAEICDYEHTNNNNRQRDIRTAEIKTRESASSSDNFVETQFR